MFATPELVNISLHTFISQSVSLDYLVVEGAFLWTGVPLADGGRLDVLGTLDWPSAVKNCSKMDLLLLCHTQSPHHQSHPSTTPCLISILTKRRHHAGAVGVEGQGNNLVALCGGVCAACWSLRASTHAWRCSNTILFFQSVHHPISTRHMNQQHMCDIPHDLDSVWC
jgi:hypothetical protein